MTQQYIPSPIMDLFYGRGADHRGRSLDELQDQDHDALEHNHDYIQWLFPLSESSGANSHAPTLTEADIAAFRGNPALRMKLSTSFRIMMRFYGLDLMGTESGFLVKEIPTFDERKRVWLTPLNHNYLRLTRILRSMTLLGCAPHAQALLTGLERLYKTYGNVIGPETLNYWRNAVKGER